VKTAVRGRERFDCRAPSAQRDAHVPGTGNRLPIPGAGYRVPGTGCTKPASAHERGMRAAPNGSRVSRNGSVVKVRRANDLIAGRRARSATRTCREPATGNRQPATAFDSGYRGIGFRVPPMQRRFSAASAEPGAEAVQGRSGRDATSIELPASGYRVPGTGSVRSANDSTAGGRTEGRYRGCALGRRFDCRAPSAQRDAPAAELVQGAPDVGAGSVRSANDSTAGRRARARAGSG
jgi:hypothetical protein